MHTTHAVLRRSLTTRSQTRNGREALITLSLEEQLAPELLVVLVEPSPELAFTPVNLPSLQPHRDRLVRLTSDNEVLVVRVRLFNALLVGAHEANTGNDTSGDVGELELEEETVLAGDRVPDLGDAISRAADLDGVLLDLYTSK